MIVRLVTMSFDDDNIELFLDIFLKYKSQIRATKGCTHLSLIRNIDKPNEISTLSHWVDVEHLNNYRKSTVFQEVWPQTKTLFNLAPTAISYSILTNE